MRTNIVGTHWLCVARCSSISASACSASNFLIATTVPPVAVMTMQKRSGAAWYIGAGDR
jgi:hypothetical protein